MSTHKNIDRICIVVTVLALILTVLFMNGSALGIEAASRNMGYEDTLFDTSRVHTIDIVIDDWEAFLETCENEEYSVCSVVIDNEAVKNVAIRGKGNTSLSTVRTMGSQRYSFKIEFDQYDDAKNYHGLDKLSLNNIIQDNTYMKDYLSYRLMAEFGVDTPLCSFVYITVNGEDWGLYLAVEGVEDSFLERNYGRDTGELYKPDSLSFGGGGPGNGKDFNMDDFMKQNEESAETGESAGASGFSAPGNLPDGFDPSQFTGDGSGFPDGVMGDFDPSQLAAGGESASGFSFPGGAMGGFDPSQFAGGNGQGTGTGSDNNGNSRGFSLDFGGMFGGMGSSDVKLQYIDDDPDSYSNIFNNAKTDVNKADQTRLIQSLKKLSEQEDLESILDMDEVIRYFVVHNYVCNGDSYTGSIIHNYYLHESDGRLSMIPWDYNLAFGTFQSSDATDTVNDPIDTPMSAGSSGDRPMWDWIQSSEEYKELYHQYFAEFLDSVDITGIIDEAYELIRSYVEKDPTAFCSYEEFETGVATLRTFCELRTESIRGQLEGSIPTTDDGQRTNSSTKIDASQINISDMGSMGGGGRGGKGGIGGFSFSVGADSSGMSGFPGIGSGSSGAQGEQGSVSIPDGSGGSSESGEMSGFPSAGSSGQGSQGGSGFPGGSGVSGDMSGFPGAGSGSFSGQGGPGGFSFPGASGESGDMSGFPGEGSGSFSGQGGPGGFSFPGGSSESGGMSGFPGAGSFGDFSGIPSQSPGQGSDSDAGQDGQNSTGGKSSTAPAGGFTGRTGGERPSGAFPSSSGSGNAWLLVGISVAVLLIGLFIAIKSKRGMY